MIKKKVLAMVISGVMCLGLFGGNVIAEEKSVKNLPKFTSEKVSFSDTVRFIMNNKELFSTKTDEIDELGFRHVKMKQMFNDIPVYGNEYVVHYDGDGNVYALNGDVDLKIEDKLHEKDAVRKAADKWLNKKEISSDRAVEVAKNYVGTPGKTESEESQMYFYLKNNEYFKVYEVKLNYMYPEPANWSVFVSTYDGEVIESIKHEAHFNHVSSGEGVLGDKKQLKTTAYNGLYYLYEVKPSGAKIATFDANNTPVGNTAALPGNYYAGSDDIFNESRDRAAVDAQYYGSRVYDYYKEKFNRDSIDGRGMNVISSVHYGNNYANAFWNGKQMVYGDGDSTMRALSGAADVVGHELTHGVTNFSADLIYKDQSGALNESFSDVFGTFIEFKLQPQKADWLIGEDLYSSGALRDMKNPERYNQPAHMRDYINTTRDNGGVHFNSGIPNKAAYLITKDIGIDKAEKIYYRALTAYLTRTSDFQDAKYALVQSAKDYYGNNSREASVVEKAFESVGI